MRPSASWKLVTAVWLLMMAVRQDFWLWRDPTLVFGALPVGLAYQAGYSLLAALVTVDRFFPQGPP